MKTRQGSAKELNNEATPARTGRRGCRKSSPPDADTTVGGGSRERGGGRKSKAAAIGELRKVKGKKAPPARATNLVTDTMVLFFRSPAYFGQWTPSRFVIDGTEYCTAEQWMMASKARLFGDEEMLTRIMSTEAPREHKRLGRLVKNFDADLWDSRGYELVVQGNMSKFTQNPRFREELLATGDKIIAEASPFDRKWGIGLGASHPDALELKKWRGKNLLGKALMEVRARIRKGIGEEQGDAPGAGVGVEDSQDLS